MNEKANSSDGKSKIGGGVFNCRYDKYFTLIDADDHLFEFLGYTREEFSERFHNHILDAVYEGDRKMVMGEISRQLKNGSVFMYENRLVKKGGTICWAWISAEVMENKEEGCWFHCIFHDISREKEAQRQLAISEQRYEIVLSQMQDIIFELDCVTYEIYYSPNFEKKFGYQIPAEGFPDSMFATDIVYEADKAGLRGGFQAILKGNDKMECEYRLKSRDGSYLWVDVHATALRDGDGRLLKILGIISDIDQRKKEIIKARKAAALDPLTGLLNRRECEVRAEQYMQQGHDPAAMLLIDVDNFKHINDTYGHLFGDKVLNETAGSLRGIFRHEDIVARIGGDEFVVFMTNIQKNSVIEAKVNAIRNIFDHYTNGENTCSIGCSIGVSFYPEHGTDFMSLFAKADAAMYRAKKNGKGQYCIYGAWKNRPEEQVVAREAQAILPRGYTQTENPLERELAHKEMVYRAALKEAHINVWEYDMRTRTLFLTEGAQESHGFRQLEHAPEALLENGYIHPRSRQDLLDLYSRLQNGQSHVQADILTRSADRSYWWWERVSYALLCDENNRPCCAVAVGEDITKQKKAEMVYQQEMQLRLTYDGGVIASFRCNLDQNCVEYVEGQVRMEYPPGMTYEELMVLHNESMANEEDKLRLQKMMSRDALCRAYKEGSTVINFEYRRKDRSGRLSWVNAVARLVRDVQNGDLYVYGTLEDINEKKNLELALKFRAEYDVQTGVYNKETAIQMIGDALLKNQGRRQAYALLVFNVDFFTKLVHEIGYVAADDVLKEISNQLKLRFIEDAIIGRFYGDEFVVFLYNNPRAEFVRQCAEDVIKTIALPYMFPNISHPVNVSCGIIFDNCPEHIFQGLYQMARAALETGISMGRSGVFVYSDHLKKYEPGNPGVPDTLRNTAQTELGSAGETVLLQGMFALTSAADFGHALENVLGSLASYYGGDRAYVIECEPESGKIREVYEWKKEDMFSAGVSGSPYLYPGSPGGWKWEELGRLQLIQDIEQWKEKRSGLYKNMKSLGIDSCYLVSLEDGEKRMGYMEIDNPKRNTEHTTILTTIQYFVANELTKRRLQEEQEFLMHHDGLTGVLNRNSYKEFCSAIREESLISLGIVSVDINGLKDINRIYGNAYGDNVIQFTADIMQEEFPAARVYRFTGDEFLLVSENISHDAFEKRLKKMRERMREAASVSVGGAWSDTDISLDFLIASADERRMIAKQEYYNEHPFAEVHRSAGILKELLKEISAGRFTVYLQPKIDTYNNTLCGAEALVRYQDPKKGIVPPGKFIPYLETAGLIHYIDFFVFEEVCKILKEWERRGVELIPVSLNFSRATLLEEQLIERMEEIIFRYGVDKRYVEIEITESMGEVERNTVAQIGKQICQAGYNIALDDFGAKYSNLSFLSAIRFNHLKLDKGLVNNLLTNEKARIIVKNILTLCQELCMEVVAEGVENREQLEILKNLECFYIQGYYFNKPLSRPEFEKQYQKTGNPGTNSGTLDSE